MMPKLLQHLIFPILAFSLCACAAEAQQSLPQDESAFYRAQSDSDVGEDGADSSLLTSIDLICGNDPEPGSAVREGCDLAKAELLPDLVKSWKDGRAAKVRILEVIALEREFALESAKSALSNQSRYAEIIFWITIGITLLGVTAAAIQFYFYWARRRDVGELDLEISKEKISLKTAWMGVILLSISALFFLAYVIFVFQLKPI